MIKKLISVILAIAIFATLAVLGEATVTKPAESIITDVYNSAAVDEVNNNSFVDISSDQESSISLFSESSPIPEEFLVDPINSPFNQKINGNEAVSLSTGALTFNKDILSLSGRNGLDLNLTVKYNSDAAVIVSNEYELNSTTRNRNFNTFAVGWSFGFDTIKLKKDKSDRGYEYNSERTLCLKDGSSYKLDNQNKLENYLLDDLTLEEKNKEYVLTRTNGVIEHFSSDYGSITKIEDKFGNEINFSYTDVSYFRGSFEDFVNSPDLYKSTYHAIDKITDSLGREINFSYEMAKNMNGTSIGKITISMGEILVGTINLDRKKCYNGQIDTVSSIIDGENLKTEFSYNEEVGYIYYNDLDADSFSFNGSNILMNKITYPTGGCSEYTYQKKRRSYTYIGWGVTTPVSDWYNVFKVIKKIDSSGENITYSYEGDYSGYPYSGPDVDTGVILNSDISYNTIVNSNNLNTMYTFDYKHNLVREQSYSDDSGVTHLAGEPDSNQAYVLNNEIYHVATDNNAVLVYKYDRQNSKTDFLSMYEIPVKGYKLSYMTQNNRLYLIVKSYKDSKLSYNIAYYDALSNSWVEEDSYSIDDSTGYYEKFLDGDRAYSNGILYYYRLLKENDITYSYVSAIDFSKQGDARFSFSKNELGELYDSIVYIFTEGTKVYYHYKYDAANTIYRLDLVSNSSVSAHFPHIFEYDRVAGFGENGRTYFYSYFSAVNDRKVYEFAFENGQGVILGEYDKIIMSNNFYDNANPMKTMKGYDNNIYCILNTVEKGALNTIYKFDHELGWAEYTYSLRNFYAPKVNCLIGSSYLYLYNGMDVEVIDLDAPNKERIVNENEYNEFNQLIKSTSYVFKNESQKKISEESYSYVQGQNAVLESTDALGNVTKYEYTDSPYFIPTKTVFYADTDNEIITENSLSTDKKKLVTSTTFYSDRQEVHTFGYDSTFIGNLTSETTDIVQDDTTKNIRSSTISYDSLGGNITERRIKNNTTLTDSFSQSSLFDLVESFTYDNFGRTLSKTDFGGKTTSYEYNNNGWVTKVTNPDGSFVKTSYLCDGGTNKVTTSYNDKYYNINYFDLMGNIKVQKEKGSTGEEITLKSYDYENGRCSNVTDGKGNATKYGYDEYGRIVLVQNFDTTEKLLLEQKAIYDEYNLKKTVFVGDKEKSSTYDNIGRIISEQVGDNMSTYEYDYVGNVIRKTDGLGNITQNTYNDLGQLLKTTNPIGLDTIFEYDIYGNNSKTVTPGGSAISYEYDTLGRNIKITDAVGKTEYFAYDNLNNIKSSKDKNENITSYSYDTMNRLTSKTTGDLHTGYTYDDLGNTLTMADNSGTTEYSYTYNSRLSSIKTPDNKTISYSYDVSGNVIHMTDYQNQGYSYTYDGLSRLDTVLLGENTIAKYDYTGFNTINKITGIEGDTVYFYDNQLRCISLTNSHKNGAQINRFDYEYDKVGNQTKKTETVSNEQKITSYAYDKLGRLCNVVEPDNTTTAYSFDKNNNISTKDVTHTPSYTFDFTQYGTDYTLGNVVMDSTTYSYDLANKLKLETQTIAGAGEDYSGMIEILNGYEYDNNGNTLKKSVGGQVDDYDVNYTYNQWNQLTSYRDKDDNLTSYSYDGTGMRTGKTTNNITTKFYWDRGYIVNEYENDVANATNIVGNTGIIGRKENNQLSYFFKNAHGDVVATSQNGTITKTYDYDPYGIEKNPSATDTNPFRYSGEYYDSESNSYYLRNRYYTPVNGRFITEDPIRDGDNWYGYCGNNPANRVDPNGESWIADKMKAAWSGTKWAFNTAGYYANEFQKATQRQFWETGSQWILREYYGFETSAWMLEHSLQDSPEDIWRGNDSRIAFLINTDSGFSAKVNEAIINSNGYNLDNAPIGVVFNGGDLYYSIHKSTIVLTGFKRDDGTWIIHCILTDIYDFTEIQSFMSDNGEFDFDASLGTLANDAAVISQNTGAIEPYNITVDFWITR